MLGWLIFIRFHKPFWQIAGVFIAQSAIEFIVLASCKFRAKSCNGGLIQDKWAWPGLLAAKLQKEHAGKK